MEQFNDSNFVLNITDVVQNLIEKKQVIDAVKFMCAFKLSDKFSPALLLKEYVEDARRSYRTIWLEEESLDEKVALILLTSHSYLLKYLNRNQPQCNNWNCTSFMA